MFQTGTDITGALQAEVDRLAAAGGGEVVFPPGQYTFRPLRLRSNLCLTLSAGARLTASPRREDYFPIGYHHNEMGEVSSALYALDQEHITLRGEGVLDLDGVFDRRGTPVSWRSYREPYRPGSAESGGNRIASAGARRIASAPSMASW